ncbi:AMP-dependent synthetase [Pseudooceanicola sediminis]|uniref:AMP-dependent synthetase n=1 Tax=Pseudooceanicola sediminis TaxID=2211117 RepID=A0A399J1F2_9RHOB|nr:AMP-binding protein [Pseudooceanicola sediminis]KAA2316187.1 AMP-binding protein [Puniceibacterium sp. HSS470]RII39100.1 AMP-dependent synthetase [Pseudooceanicola sediminis]|tara:strand:+ start:78453 stop:80018 length:1566 start_codon:yes stop_codon:yes gene_type:complete
MTAFPDGAGYDEIYRDFSWQIPEHLNMAGQVCDTWAERAPERTAIIDLTEGTRRDVSYGDLRAMADHLALALRDRGVARGGRVGVLRSQDAWCAAAHIAAWKLGAISVPLFKLFREEALRSRVEDCGAGIVVTDAEGAAMLAPLDVAPLVPEATDLPKGRCATADMAADEAGVLIYTSGTTGKPKGALHAHRVLSGHLPGVALSHDMLGQPGDCIWTPADWAWIGGLFDVLMPGLALGVPVVAARMAKFDVAECLRIVAQGNVKNVFFPPTALRMLKAQGARVQGLRTVASAGEPLGAEMLAWGSEAFGLTINEFYGQTECNMAVTSCAALFAPRPGCAGKSVPGFDVTVIGPDGWPCTGEGDVAIRRGTPAMMLEYWNKPEATAEKFRGDWLLTGDRGVMEGDFLRFLGREDDVITSAGYRIGPSEIEDCLMTHPAVATVGVVGKPDALRTEIVKAYVVLKPGVSASAKELGDHVKTRLASYSYPREIAFVDALPMTVTGKVIRKELKARAVAETTGEDV